MSNAIVIGKAPAPGYKVYVDTRNFGKLGPNDPWDISNSVGDFEIESQNAITNMQPVRYVDPKNADGVSSPPGVDGIHIVLALGQTASNVNFAPAIVVPPVAAPPVASPVTPEPVPAPVVVAPPATVEPTPVVVPPIVTEPATPAVASLPAAPVPSQFSIGWCLGGVNDAAEPTVAEVVAAAAPLGGAKFGYVNMWSTCDNTKPINVSQQFEKVIQFAAQGIKTIWTWNPQNSGPQGSSSRCTVPPDAVLEAHFNSYPLASTVGNPIIELATEYDNPTYFAGTAAHVGDGSIYDIARLFKVAGPILTAKGYLWGTNCLKGTGWFPQLYKAGALAGAYFIGHHAFDSTSQASLAEFTAFDTFAASIGFGNNVICTQTGLHNANWTVECPKQWTGILAWPLKRPWLYFQLFQSSQPAGACAPYTKPNVRTAVWNAIQPVLAAA